MLRNSAHVTSATASGQPEPFSIHKQTLPLLLRCPVHLRNRSLDIRATRLHSYTGFLRQKYRDYQKHALRRNLGRTVSLIVANGITCRCADFRLQAHILIFESAAHCYSGTVVSSKGRMSKMPLIQSGPALRGSRSEQRLCR